MNNFTNRFAILHDALQRDAENRTTVLATIDELNQYLQGNVTLEATTDAVQLLFIQLEVFVAKMGAND